MVAIAIRRSTVLAGTGDPCRSARPTSVQTGLALTEGSVVDAAIVGGLAGGVIGAIVGLVAFGVTGVVIGALGGAIVGIAGTTIGSAR